MREAVDIRESPSDRLGFSTALLLVLPLVRPFGPPSPARGEGRYDRPPKSVTVSEKSPIGVDQGVPDAIGWGRPATRSGVGARVGQVASASRRKAAACSGGTGLM